MDHPVIDWDLSKRLAGNNLKNAKEFLALLAKDLLKELSDIKQSYELNNFEEIKTRIHKLQGALSYCGLPRLKLVTIALENALKKNTGIPTLMSQFEFEINQVIKYAKQGFFTLPAD